MLPRILCCDGVSFVGYILHHDRTLIGLRGTPIGPHRRGEYSGFRVKHPTTGKYVWLPAHKAWLETFHGRDPNNPIAAHGRGTSKADFGPGVCTWKDASGNQRDRWRDGTASRGTLTGLRGVGCFVDEILRLDNWGYNRSEIARRFNCTPQAIRYHLKKHGRI